MSLWVCVCMCVWVIVAYYYVCMWCIVYVYVKVHVHINSTTHPFNQCNCRVKNICPLLGKCLYKNVVYKVTVKTNNSVRHYISATEGNIKQRLYNQTFFHKQKLLIQCLLILIHMAPKRHEHLSHNHLGDTKASTCIQQNIKKCLICLHEKLAIITYPSQNTQQNKKIWNSFKM